MNGAEPSVPPRVEPWRKSLLIEVDLLAQPAGAGDISHVTYCGCPT
jgi:hypothetical protein